MANLFYNRAAKRILAGELNLNTATLKVMLVTSAYVANRDHDFISSGVGTVGGSEVAGTGYVGGFGGAGRKTIAAKVFSEDDVNDRGEMDCNDITWLAVNGFTAAAAVVVQEVTTDADSELIAYIDTASPVFPVTANGGDITLQVNVEGLLHLLTT